MIPDPGRFMPRMNVVLILSYTFILFSRQESEGPAVNLPQGYEQKPGKTNDLHCAAKFPHMTGIQVSEISGWKGLAHRFVKLL